MEVDLPHVSITCLLTGAPPLGVHKHSQSLHRGLNFVTVCVTLSAAFMGYQVVRQPLWIEGKDIQQGVKVLSGFFDLSQISSHVILETARPHSDPSYNARLVDLACVAGGRRGRKGERRACEAREDRTWEDRGRVLPPALLPPALILTFLPF